MAAVELLARGDERKIGRGGARIRLHHTAGGPFGANAQPNRAAHFITNRKLSDLIFAECSIPVSSYTPHARGAILNLTLSLPKPTDRIVCIFHLSHMAPNMFNTGVADTSYI